MSVKTPSMTNLLPPPEEIARRIESCQEELAALRKLLRVSVTAHKAEQAGRRRQKAEQGGCHAD
jgi:hypothetical protein